MDESCTTSRFSCTHSLSPIVQKVSRRTSGSGSFLVYTALSSVHRNECGPTPKSRSRFSMQVITGILLGCYLSHGFGDFLFAEEDLQQAEFGLQLFVLLVFLLHWRAILFLADSVGKHSVCINVMTQQRQRTPPETTRGATFPIFQREEELNGCLPSCLTVKPVLKLSENFTSGLLLCSCLPQTLQQLRPGWQITTGPQLIGSSFWKPHVLLAAHSATCVHCCKF